MATKEFGTVNIKGSYILDTDEARKKLEDFKKDAESPVKVKIEDPSLKNLQASITRTKQEAVKLGEELQKAINAGDKKKATSLDSMLSSKLRQVERYETSFVQFQKKINAEVKKIEQQAAKSNASINKSTTNNVASGNVPAISKEMQEELNKLEKQKEEYKSLLSEINKVSKMAASYEDGDSISLGFKATEEAAQKLINRYYELQKAVQQAKVDSVEFASAMTEQTKIALQLYELNDKLTKRDHNNNLIKESPSFLREFVSVDEYGDSTVALAVSDFADYFDQLKETANKSIDGVKAKIAELKSTLKDASSIKQDAGSLVDTAAINEANNSIEELSQKLQSIREMSYSSGKEFAFTVDKNGLQLYIESAECVTKAADEASIAVQSLNNNLNILGHTHPDGDGLFSVADIISTIEQKLSGINMPIVALGDKIASVLNLDGVSAEVLSQVKDKLWGLSNNAPVSPKMFTEIKEIFAAGGSPDAIQTINIANGFNELSEALIKISSNAKEAQDPLEKLKNLISYYSGKKLNTDNMSSFSTYWDDFNSGAKKALEVFNEVMSQLNANTLENQDFKIDTNKTVGTSGDTADVQKINQRIGELQKIINNQNDWIKYLGDALNPDKFKTSGKKEATEQLRDLTKKLVSARQENYESLSWRQYAEEILELSHARAYQEAERQNIASSNLTRYYSDAESNYESNLKTLQEAYTWYQKTLTESQAELSVLQSQLNQVKEIASIKERASQNKLFEQPSGQLSLFEGVAESANRASESVDNLKNKVQEVYTVPGQLSLFDAGAQGSIEQLGTAAANALNNSVKDTNIDDLINQAGNAADANKYKIESFGKAAENALAITQQSDLSKALTPTSTGNQIGDLGGSQTASSIDIAAEAIRNEGAAAEQAAIKKKQFAAANREVAASGKETAKSINDATKAVGSEGQSVERAKAYYDELYRLMNNINAKDSEILKLSGKNSNGMYTDYINELQSQKGELIARVRSIGEQVAFEFGNSIQGINQYSLSGARFFDEQDTANINAFLNSVQAQSVLTAQDIDKLSVSFQNSKKIGIEFANQVSASMAEVNKISSNIFKIDENTGFITGAKSNIDETIQMYQNAKIAYEQLNYVKQKLSSKPEADWSAQEAALLQALIERFKEYGSVLDQAVQKERQYFSGKTKFDASTTSIGDFSKQAEQEAQKVTEIQKKLEEAAQQFAKNSKFDGGAIVTNFEQLSNGVYSLEFACQDASGVMQTFRAEMGQTSKDIYIDANQINSAFKTMSDAKKQLMSMNNLKNILDASGISTDINTAAGPLKTFLDNWQKLQAAITNPATSPDILAKLLKDAKLSSVEIEKLYKQFVQLENLVGSGDAIGLGKINFSGDITQQLKDSLAAWGEQNNFTNIKLTGLNEATGKFKVTAEGADNTVRTFTGSLNKLSQSASMQQTNVTELGSKWDRFKASLSKTGKQLMTALVGYNVFFKVISEIRKGINYVKDIDLAMTELKKVTDESEASYNRFLETASKSASIVGSTVSSFTEATANFARLGYSIDESAKMAETAIVYKNVADGLDTVDEATESIISTMKAFGIESSDTMGIIDRFNEVGKLLPVDNYIG